MTKPFTKLYDAMPLAARQEVQSRVKKMLADMPLNEFRQVRGLSRK